MVGSRPGVEWDGAFLSQRNPRSFILVGMELIPPISHWLIWGNMQYSCYEMEENSSQSNKPLAGGALSRRPILFTIYDKSSLLIIHHFKMSSITFLSIMQIRIGLCSGTVTCGMVGDVTPRCLVFGPAVNLASRLESHGLAGKIQVNQETREWASHSFSKEIRDPIIFISPKIVLRAASFPQRFSFEFVIIPSMII